MEVHATVTKDGEFLFRYLLAKRLMEQLLLIIQQIQILLDILNGYTHDKREELVAGYRHLLFEVKVIIAALDKIVEGNTYWGWKIEWGYQLWQVRTYQQQRRLTLQAGWEDRVDFGINLYQEIPVVSQRVSKPVPTSEVLPPIDLNAFEAEESKLESTTDTCEAGHIQHERPVAFHEFIAHSSSSSSEVEILDGEQELSVVREDSDLDSMPDLEDETNLDSIEIPLWLIPNGVLVTFRGGWVIFKREQGPPWQEVLTQMLEEQNTIVETG